MRSVIAYQLIITHYTLTHTHNVCKGFTERALSLSHMRRRLRDRAAFQQSLFDNFKSFNAFAMACYHSASYSAVWLTGILKKHDTQ